MERQLPAELRSTYGNRAIRIGEREYRLERPLYRTFTLDRQEIDEESRTVSLSFSSEAPVERWFGTEILDHDPQSVRLGRLNSSGPLLVNHDPRIQIGVVERAEVGSDRRGRAVVRFGRSARADEEFRDVLDGIRVNVSVGYMVHRMVLEESSDEDGDVFRVVDWEPLEISLVSIPADTSVGVGRQDGFQGVEPERLVKEESGNHTEVRDMKGNITQQAKQTPPQAPQVRAQDSQVTPPAAPQVTEPDGSRVAAEMLAIAQQFARHVPEAYDLARQILESGGGVDAYRQALLEKMGRQDPVAAVPDPVDIQMSEGEQRQYSILRAIRIAAGLEDDGIELDISQEIAKKLGRSTRGIYVPMSLRKAPYSREVVEKVLGRALVSTGGEGQELVPTEMGDLIELLRNRMMVRRLGARVLSGLNGNVSFPRQTGSGTLSWVAENPGSDLADSDATLDQVTLSPKSAMSTTAYSRQLLAQSSIDVDMFVRDDLMAIGALGLDYAAIAGTGTGNEPTGILNTTGVGLVVGGTDGAAPTWDHIVDLESEVAIDNADVGNLAYLTNAKVRGKLKKTTKVSGDAGAGFVWERGDEPGFGEMNGYRAAVSNQVPSNLDKGASVGVCSAIIFGNFADLLIGEWGTFEIIADPYSKKKQALVELTLFFMADVAVRHPESFAVMKDALTA